MPNSDQAAKIEQDPTLARYSRQMLFEPIGEAGQRKLLESRVLLVGCGALGTVLASTLGRAGVGFLRVVDRDFIEENNLQRQVLFDEDDIAAGVPKAEAARAKLVRINSTIEVDAVVADVNPGNIETLAEDVDLLLDGTDNFETRFLINDVAVKHGKPWVYGACIGATGLVMPIIPNETPCIRCVFEHAPPPEMNPTCDTAGVIAPIVNIVASYQAVEAIKLLIGRRDALTRKLLNIDAWSGYSTAVNVQKAYDEGDCPCCKQKKFDYLAGVAASSSTTLCGRNAVQITPPAGGHKVDFEQIAEKMHAVAETPPTFNRFMLKASIGAYKLTVFPDGRAIVQGTNKPDAARGIYAKYVGS
jgi:adenylyltransferase/sulfurtransferase